MMKLVVALYDNVAENVLNLMVEDNDLTLERNLQFALENLKNSPIRPQDVDVRVVAKLDTVLGTVTPVEPVISTCLSEFVKGDTNDEVNPL